MKKIIVTLFTVLFAFTFSLNVVAAPVDINAASAADIEASLKGVGPVKAKAIVDYRQKNGKFKSVDDLMSVKGVGEKTVKSIKSDVRLSGRAGVGSGKQAAASSKAKTKQGAKTKVDAAKKSTKKSTKKATKKATKTSTKKTGTKAKAKVDVKSKK